MRRRRTFLVRRSRSARSRSRTDRLAKALCRLGVTRGDRVGIMLANCPQYMVSAFAILRLGAIVVNINPIYTAREFETVAKDSGVKVLITLDQLAPMVLDIRERCPVEHIIVTSLAEYSARSHPVAVHSEYAGAQRAHRVRPWIGSAVDRDRRRRCGRPPVHGRHDRHAKRSDAVARQHLRQRRPDRDLAQSRLPSR